MTPDIGRPFEFGFSSSQLALDFTKTLSGRTKSQPVERLSYYDDLVHWGRQAGALTDLDAQRLLREARRRPGRAQAVLEHAIALREAGADAIIARPVAPEAGMIEETIRKLGAEVWPRVEEATAPP